MKYLKTKSSRRRGAGLELAMMLFLTMTAVTILVVNATMIQVEKQKQSYKDLIEVVNEIDKMQIDQVAKSFVIFMDNYYEDESIVLDENGMLISELIFNIKEQLSNGETKETCEICFAPETIQSKGSENNYEQSFVVAIFTIVYEEGESGKRAAEPKSQFNIKFDVVIEDGKAKYQTYTIIN